MGIILQIFSNWKPLEAEPTPATISYNVFYQQNITHLTARFHMTLTN